MCYIKGKELRLYFHKMKKLHVDAKHTHIKNIRRKNNAQSIDKHMFAVE